MSARAALAALLVALAASGTRAAEPVDSCASFLGSLAVELRIARNLPPGRATSFTCPRELRTRPALGASQARVRNALGPPDRHEAGADGGARWVYRFATRYGSPTGLVPELAFRFDAAGKVAGVDCERLG